MAQVPNQRIRWIDTARGIGIIAVVVGHSVIQGGDAALWIFAFHMPLFFILSGYTSSFNENVWGFVRKKMLSLVLPYVVTLLIFYMYWLLFYKWYSGDLNSPMLIASMLMWGGLYGSGMVLPQFPGVLPIGPLWFLLALFSVNLLSFGVMLVARRSFIAAAALVSIATMIGLTIGPRFYLPFSLDVALVALVFVFAGVALRSTGVMSLSRSWVLIVACIGALVISWYNGAMDMNGRNYNDFFISGLGAIGGSLLVLFSSTFVERFPRIERVLSYIGRASLVILCFHTADATFLRFPEMVPNLYPWLEAHSLFWSILRLFFSLIVFELFRRIPLLRYAYSLPGVIKSKPDGDSNVN